MGSGTAPEDDSPNQPLLRNRSLRPQVWRRRGWPAAVLWICLVLVPLLGEAAQAQMVTDLTAQHYMGQTFLTWKRARGPVSSYVVYRAMRPLRTAFELRLATRVAELRPGGARNVRLESIVGTPQYFRIPGAAAPLTADDELCVLTVATTRDAWYAVTCVGARGEITQVMPGRNCLQNPVSERQGKPAPLFQQRLVWNERATDVFVHWASNVSIAAMPAMTNRVSQPFNLAVVKNGKAPLHPLVVRLHGLGDNFLSQVWSSGNPQEYVLALDDALPGEVKNSYWVGWNQSLDVASDNIVPPASGRVVEYTARRVRWTVQWARTSMPIDTARVCIVGFSMGASGTLYSALTAPWLFAAATALLPRVTYVSNGSAGAPTGSRRFEQVWGRASTRPLMRDGTPVYERTRFATLLQSIDPARLPLLTLVSGRKDATVGWPQILEAYAAIRDREVGARVYWDMRGHEVDDSTWWRPMEHMFNVSGMRSDESFVAITHATSDQDPGDGTPASGDSTGQWGAFVEWRGPVIDLPDRWSMSLNLRPLRTRDGMLEPPETVLADLTPRRLQHFVVTPGSWYLVSQTNPDGTVRTEEVRAGKDGLTLFRIPLHPSPSRIDIRPLPFPVRP